MRIPATGHTRLLIDFRLLSNQCKEKYGVDLSEWVLRDYVDWGKLPLGAEKQRAASAITVDHIMAYVRTLNSYILERFSKNGITAADLLPGGTELNHQ